MLYSNEIFMDTLYSSGTQYAPMSIIVYPWLFLHSSSSSRYLNIIREWVRLIVTIKFSLIIEFSTKYRHLYEHRVIHVYSSNIQRANVLLKIVRDIENSTISITLSGSSSTSLSGDYLKAHCNYQRRFSVWEVETEFKIKNVVYAAKNKKHDNNQGALIVNEVGPVVCLNSLANNTRTIWDWRRKGYYTDP